MEMRGKKTRHGILWCFSDVACWLPVIASVAKDDWVLDMVVARK